VPGEIFVGDGAPLPVKMATYVTINDAPLLNINGQLDFIDTNQSKVLLTEGTTYSTQ
jgi:hypothetical protein